MGDRSGEEILLSPLILAAVNEDLAAFNIASTCWSAWTLCSVSDKIDEANISLRCEDGDICNSGCALFIPSLTVSSSIVLILLLDVSGYDDQCSFKPCDLLVALLFYRYYYCCGVAAKLLHECFVSTPPDVVMCYYADLQIEICLTPIWREFGF